MGGPAMIEGGGLGVYRPEEVGPVSVQAPNGVIDILVGDEEKAVAAVKQYLSYFQGPLGQWEAADQRPLRTIIPENRLRVYDVRRVIETIADKGSVLELRHDFGKAMVTALARSKAGRSAWWPTTRCTTRAQSTVRRQIRQRASCSSATPSTGARVDALRHS
jgi:acetyl-CoA carboxylase carboxyltransferase component